MITENIRFKNNKNQHVCRHYTMEVGSEHEILRMYTILILVYATTRLQVCLTG